MLLLLLKRNDDDDYFDPVTKASSYKTVEIPVPKDMVRLLIGRNGKNIKLIQEQSNTRINFRDTDTDDRICVIRGSREGCDVADNLVREFLVAQPLLESEDLWVPQSSVGKIIGRCGERIHEISTISGAKVNVSDVGRAENTRRITLKGNVCLGFVVNGG